MPLDYATRAAMLQREVEAVARMDSYTPPDVLDLMRGSNAVRGMPWISNMLSKDGDLSSLLSGSSSGSSPSASASSNGTSSNGVGGGSGGGGGALRRDVPAERAEQRSLLAPLVPRSNRPRHPAMLERRGSRVNLNDSTGSTPKDPNSPPDSEADSPAAAFPPLPPATGPMGSHRPAATSSQHEDMGGAIDLSKCISLLDDDDLAGLAAAEAAFAVEDRARQLAREVKEAASKPLEVEPPPPSEPVPAPPQPSPRAALPPLPAADDSPFLGVELSLD